VDWVQQNPGVATALIAALAAIAGGIVAAAARFLFDTYLSEQLRRRWQAVETIRRYASPIIHAVDDLAGPKGIGERLAKTA
jgi:biopolymer transport protein ExbB/TolQ